MLHSHDAFRNNHVCFTFNNDQQACGLINTCKGSVIHLCILISLVNKTTFYDFICGCRKKGLVNYH